MPKINQEEYEILKGLDDKWKWVARDERHNSVCVHSLKPIKEEYGWTNIISEYNFLDARCFQFIQWEDSEPYNIDELIEEYESEEVENARMALKAVLGYIDQLDEPEVLSEEWIERNTSPVDDEGRLYVWKSDLKNLLVPKQEVNLRVQELIEKYEQEDGEHSNPENAWIDDFIADLESLIEKVQKYYVINNDNRMMLVRMMDGKTITEADPFKLEDMYEVEKKSHRLTEQEIKDYDPRYWAFAKPVEELEE